MGGDGRDSSGARDPVNRGSGFDRLLALSGHDVLFGAGGADEFAFAVAPVTGGEWWLAIRDFKTGPDRISVSDAAFNRVGSDGFAGAARGAIQFGCGNPVKTADQGLTHDEGKGSLFCDAGGSGTQADWMLRAKPGAGTGLGFQDFCVVWPLMLALGTARLTGTFGRAGRGN
jgi:hypothetical protein